MSHEIYKPVFREKDETDTKVGPLLVDETPVTNQEFLIFVKSHPQFARSKIPGIYSDPGYLSHWNGDFSFAIAEASFPVTHVSWFAARRYCASLGKRLPTIAEWEVFADSRDPKSEATILNWYSVPSSGLRAVGKGPGNKFGVKDAHGLIWEWVEDFSEVIISGDTRGGGIGGASSLFCGGAALKSKDPKLYGTFMRFAFRSSLDAKYESSNLGFRCVKDSQEKSK